jgi:N-acetylglucosamine kinase-like BadF-type ATPase
MILIADSGSTKTDWCLTCKDGEPKMISTKGINPFYQTEDEISADLQQNLVPEMKKAAGGMMPTVTNVYFYGAGCTPEKSPTVRNAIRRALSSVAGSEMQSGDAGIEVQSDMVGAARALCQHSAGIVCIMGTGSNSCYYDGKEITANVSPLGFILGDEGSGAVLGKLMVGDLLKNQMTPGLKEAFLQEYHLTQAEIIDRVYRQPFPNRFLASLNKFLEDHLSDPTVYALVLGSFVSFIRRNVMQYPYQGTPVNFIGSIAYYYRAVLQSAAAETGILLGTIMKAPMEGLIKYHK